MNWLGVVAIVAALALLTALVFLYVHRDGGNNSTPDPPSHRPQMNGTTRRLIRYSPEQLERLRDPRTGHLIGRGRLMRLYVEGRRLVTGHDSRKVS